MRWLGQLTREPTLPETKRNERGADSGKIERVDTKRIEKEANIEALRKK